MEEQPEKPSAESPQLRRVQRSLAVVAGSVLGLLIGLMAFLALRGYTTNLPRLTGESLAAAQARWEAQGPADYDLRIEVQGRQAAVYEVRVRDGLPVEARRNGRALEALRTRAAWTVPGMFGTLADDLRGGYAGRAEGPLPVVQVEFDATYGYPSRYQRLTPPEIAWEVTRFDRP